MSITRTLDAQCLVMIGSLGPQGRTKVPTSAREIVNYILMDYQPIKEPFFMYNTGIVLKITSEHLLSLCERPSGKSDIKKSL